MTPHPVSLNAATLNRSVAHRTSFPASPPTSHVISGKHMPIKSRRGQTWFSPITLSPLLGCWLFACLAVGSPREEAEAELKKCDSQLNSLFKQVSATLLEITESRHHQQLLEQSQFAWEKYREAQAKFVAFGFSSKNDGDRTAYLRESIKLAKERTEYLQRFLEPIQYQLKD